MLVQHDRCSMMAFSSDRQRERVGRKGDLVKVDFAFDLQSPAELHVMLEWDVGFLKGHKDLARDVPVSGWVYDVGTGKMDRIV